MNETKLVLLFLTLAILKHTLFISIDRKLTKVYVMLAVPPPNRAYLRTLIHSGDLEHLEKVVLDGHGHKLLHETSALEKVTKFIYALPDFMVKLLVMLEYSEVPNRRADRNKRAGLEKSAKLLAYLLSKLINEQSGIFRLLHKKLRAGGKENLKNLSEHALLLE